MNNCTIMFVCGETNKGGFKICYFDRRENPLKLA